MRACLLWLGSMLATPCGLASAAAMLVLLYAALRWRLRCHAARLEARQAARERIARELHDNLLQGTQAVILHFHNASMALPADEPARAAMLRALDAADRMLAEGRDQAQALHAATLDVEPACNTCWRWRWMPWRRRTQARSGIEDAAP